MGKICVDKGINRPVDAPFLFVHNRIYKLDFALIRVSLPISILSLFLQILDQSSLLNLLGLFETECVYCPTLPRLYQFDKLYIFCSVVLLTVQHLEMNDIIHLQFYKTSTGKRCYS